MENNNDDITLVFDLPFDGLCLFLEGTMFMSLRLNNRQSICNFERIDSNVGIRIGKIGITANSHQVLTVKAQMAKTLRQHIPSRVPSCLTDWLP